MIVDDGYHVVVMIIIDNVVDQPNRTTYRVIVMESTFCTNIHKDG